MGSAGSKASRTAGSAARKYPTRPSPLTQQAPAQVVVQAQEQPGPTVHPDQPPSETRDHAINMDASDPVLASKLRQIGPVEANPYQSHTSTQSQSQTGSRGLQIADFASLNQGPPPGMFPDEATMRSNPALMVLQARSRLQEQADIELDNVGRRGAKGREFLDVYMVTDALKMRRAGITAEAIEQKMGLRSGIMAKLGARGVLEPAYR